MKKEINNVLILASLGFLVFNGCASRSIVIIDKNYKENQNNRSILKVKTFSWKDSKPSATLSKKEKISLPENGFKTKLSSNFEKPEIGNKAFGKAHLYGKNLEGKRTASGDTFNTYQKTVGHKSLPFNTMLKVTNLENNKSEIVRVNDRGTFSEGIIINISKITAQSLGMKNATSANVKIEIVGFDGVIANKVQPKNNKKANDCIDCYASVPIRNKKIVSVKKPSNVVYPYNDYPKPNNVNIEKSTYAYDENISENRYAIVEDIDSSPLIEKFSEKIAIQIGAFREYVGAKVYAKKYALLPSQYAVEIKKNIKDEHPLYRVRIEGFSNEFEAKEFISRYGLTGAFLVRK